jgi:UDP-N-acetylmuramoylalanine--D-glutamate ligase
LVASEARPDFAVIEVSSYQLELPGELAPTAAVVLNLASDHLDRHGTMDNYGTTKTSLFKNMPSTGFAALPKKGVSNPNGLLNHGEIAAQPLWLDNSPGITREGNHASLRNTPDDGPLNLADLTLLGEHNRDNATAAALMCICVGVPRSAIDFSVLTALPHRLQPVHQSNGVTWVNDSKATNVDAALVGIAGISRPMIVLLGGAGKPGAKYQRLQTVLKESARRVVCFGAAGAEIAAAIDVDNIEQVPTLSDAVSTAAKLARAPDVVLLSPACASFDEFNNFEERGHVFTSLAQEATQ